MTLYVQTVCSLGLICCLSALSFWLFFEWCPLFEPKGEDKEYETEVITRGNCMICGKELTEGLFICKDCENKANSRK